MKPNPAVTSEPAPTRTESPAVWPLVVEDVLKGTYDAACPDVPHVWRRFQWDMQLRDESGRKKYGVPLQVENGRNALVDAYQEALDLCAYTRQQYERTSAGEDWHFHGQAVAFAAALLRRLMGA